MIDRCQMPWQDAQWSRWLTQLDQDRTPHALTLTGLPGLGKRAFAARVAASYLCGKRRTGQEACYECQGCRWLQAGTHPDLYRLMPEEGKTAISVAAARQLIGRLMLTGNSGRRVALIDPAHAMNRNSANALLKTLEEPPPGVLLLLVTELPHLLPVTLRSRCQRLAFHAPDVTVALQWLREQQPETPDKSWELALALAGGAPLRAQVLTAPDAARRRSALNEELEDLTLGKVDPGALAQAWCKDAAGLPERLDILARALAGARDGGRGGCVPAAIGSDAVARFHLYDAVNRIRADLNSSLRRDLMVEALLIQWRQFAMKAEVNQS